MAQPNEIIYVTFFTRNLSTGVVTDADVMPTASLTRNGQQDATVAAVTKVAATTGTYVAAVAVPAAWAAADVKELIATATVAAAQDQMHVWRDDGHHVTQPDRSTVDTPFLPVDFGGISNGSGSIKITLRDAAGMPKNATTLPTATLVDLSYGSGVTLQGFEPVTEGASAGEYRVNLWGLDSGPREDSSYRVEVDYAMDGEARILFREIKVGNPTAGTHDRLPTARPDVEGGLPILGAGGGAGSPDNGPYDPRAVGIEFVRTPESVGSAAGYCKDPILLHASDSGIIGVDFSLLSGSRLKKVVDVTIDAKDSAGVATAWDVELFNTLKGGVWNKLATVDLKDFDAGDTADVTVVTENQEGRKRAATISVRIA